MSDKLNEVARIFNVMFPSYVMTYEYECVPFKDIVTISINEYYRVRFTGYHVLSMSVKGILAETIQIFINLKLSEVKE